MEQLQQLLSKYNWPKRTDTVDAEIKEIEGMVEFKLPADYILFLQTCIGSEIFIREQFVRLWDANEIKELNVDYDIIGNLPDTIGIGANGGGEFIAIVNKGKNENKIVLSPFIDLHEQAHVEIGESFTDFLVRLDNGQAWFK